MAQRVLGGAGGVEVPQECGRPRTCSPRDDSPSGPGTYERRDRARGGVPSPQQRVKGHDHVLAPFSLGSPSLQLDSHGQAPLAAAANTAHTRLDLGLSHTHKHVESHTDAFSSLSLGGQPISDETQRKVSATSRPPIKHRFQPDHQGQMKHRRTHQVSITMQLHFLTSSGPTLLSPSLSSQMVTSLPNYDLKMYPPIPCIIMAKEKSRPM